jgi:MerR family redox-sensitive transcriptional activator SoxR
MKKIPIGEVATRAGITASAIRYYESEGLLPKAGRQGGRRVYDEAILDQLTFIDLSKRSGFTVAEIRKLVRGFAGSAPPGVRWRALAEEKMEALDRRIEEAQTMKRLLTTVTACECPTFHDCAEAIDQNSSIDEIRKNCC